MITTPPTDTLISAKSGSTIAWGPDALRERNDTNRAHQATVAAARKRWIEKNSYYYNSLLRLLKFLVEPGSRVLNVRCQTGFMLRALEPSHGVGVEISAEMLRVANEQHPEFKYHLSFPEDFCADGNFDYILINDIGETVDVQRTLHNLKRSCERHTRILIYTYNHLWEPLVTLAQKLRLKIPQTEQNWLSETDLRALLALSGYEWLKTHRIILLPKYIPVLSYILNRFIAKLPFISRLCMVEVLVARSLPRPHDLAQLSVSVVVPCRDERGNIEAAVRRIPELGKHTEIIFCDDNSTDGTVEEIQRMRLEHPHRDIKLVQGPGVCKSRNVWTGFRAASGDILIILDADLTVMPEELPWFVDALASGKCEFVNGSRLVYPMPRAAMKTANMIGNKFFSLMFSYLLSQDIKDTLCGTKVLWRSDWDRMSPLIGTWGTVDRWGDYELLFGAAKLNLRVLDQPIHYQERIYGATKMTRVLKNGLIMLQMCFHGFRKLKLSC